MMIYAILPHPLHDEIELYDPETQRTIGMSMCMFCEESKLYTIDYAATGKENKWPELIEKQDPALIETTMTSSRFGGLYQEIEEINEGQKIKQRTVECLDTIIKTYDHSRT